MQENQKIQKIGERIYELREKRGWSQEEFAEMLNVSRQSVSNWENGKVRIDLVKAAEISQLLGIGLDELCRVDGEGNNTKAPEKSTTNDVEQVRQSKIGGKILCAILVFIACVAAVLAIIAPNSGGISSAINISGRAGWIIVAVIALIAAIAAIIFISGGRFYRITSGAQDTEFEGHSEKISSKGRQIKSQYRKTKVIRIASEIMLWIAVAVAVIHLIWYASLDGSGGVQEVLSAVIPYGLLIAVFALFRYRFKIIEGKILLADAVFFALFSLIYATMAVHITVDGAINGFKNAYLNLPLIYLAPSMVTAIICAVVQTRPRREDKTLKKVLFALSVILLFAMAVHCTALAIIELSRENLSTSAPWWTMPLICSLCYLVGVALLFGVYTICSRFGKRRTKEKKVL